jgi:hypothetical protein
MAVGATPATTAYPSTQRGGAAQRRPARRGRDTATTAVAVAGWRLDRRAG